ncbi:hypothetical protein AGMMS49953_08210 [Endomicrobiia bacterium]|nr:hypothetical protein AGMMS49953_08210 [Endomicrobiia bacterium]
MMFTTGCGLVKAVGEEMNGTHALKKEFMLGYCTCKADQLVGDPLRCSVAYKDCMRKLLKQYSNDHNFEWDVVEKMNWDDFV